ncbi:hypothetical protein DFAR_3060023 [Desulfarculales bacterium]
MSRKQKAPYDNLGKPEMGLPAVTGSGGVIVGCAVKPACHLNFTIARIAAPGWGVK